MKIFAIILAVIIVVLLGVFLFVQPAKSPTAPVPTPQVATSVDGTLVVSAPEMNAVIASPVAIAGSAKGWYFEAVFPVKILDGDGTVLGNGQARAQSDWMTTSSVPFSATTSFTAPKYATGTIVFRKDNPSGLPKYDEEFSLPIRFRQ
jgi:hypothetical protein